MSSNKKLTPFDFVNAINQSKRDLIADSEDPAATEAQYVPYIVNRTFSYFQETVLYANEMNINHHLDKAPQFQFYLSSLRPRKRFAKWHKPDADDRITLIREYYGCSFAVAQQYADVLSTDAVEAIRSRLNQGGKG